MAQGRNDREQKTEREPESSSQQVAQRGNQERTEVGRRSGYDYVTSPFELMRRVTEQMFGPLGARASGAGDVAWVPQIEVTERDGKVVVRADLPGMSKDDVHAEVRDNMLILEGERRQERKEDREGTFITERTYGRFYRSIPLPEGVNPDSARATFKDGVLELTLDAPKRESRGRKIDIEETRQQQPQSR
jgi:HSP20 family protein